MQVQDMYVILCSKCVVRYIQDWYETTMNKNYGAPKTDKK